MEKVNYLKALLGTSLILFGILFVNCSQKPDNLAKIEVTVSDRFPKVNTKVVINITATDKEGKPLEKGSVIALSTNLGSFSKTGKVRQKNLKVDNGGNAVTNFYTGKTAGTAFIKIKSEFSEVTLTLIIQEEAKEEKPVVAEKKGEKSQRSESPFEFPLDGGEIPQAEIPPPPDMAGPGPGNISIDVQVRKKKLIANGVDFTEVEAKVIGLQPSQLKSIPVIFKTTLGRFLDPETRKPLQPLPNQKDRFPVPFKRGGYKVLLQSSTQPGQAEISVELSKKDIYGFGQAIVSIVDLGYIKFLKVDPDVLGTMGSGREVANITVQVLDTSNEPFPQGTKVYFKINRPLGGTSLSISEVPTNSKGEASTQLKSGRMVGTVNVTAFVTSPAPETAKCPASCTNDSHCSACGYRCHLGKCKKIIEATSPNIAIVGGKPSYRGMTFLCEKINVGVLHNQLGQNQTTILSIPCHVYLADRFTNKVGFPTKVMFLSEAGAIDPQATTVAASVKSNPGKQQTETVGWASVNLRTQNPPPADVPPLSVPNIDNCKPGTNCTQPKSNGYWFPYNCVGKYPKKTMYVEPWYIDYFGRQHNPRDGLVTVIAYTDGEEEFTDVNNNGKYDPGEPFIDLPEPFVDVNDNNKWDSRLPGYPNGEPFVDIPCTAEEVRNKVRGCTTVNQGNGRHDGPNGKWDSNTKIWKKTWVLWTGCTAPVNAKINPMVDLKTCKEIPFHLGPYVTDKSAAQNSDYLPYKPSYFVVDPARPIFFKFLWVDINLNPLTKESTADYTADGDIKIAVFPKDLRVSAVFGSYLGFSTYTLVKPIRGAAYSRTLEVVPSSFVSSYGRSFSHKVVVESTNTQKAKSAKPVALSVDIKAIITTGRPTGCTISYRYQGKGY